MWAIIQKGGPVMWPLLLTLLIALSIVIERCLFIFIEMKRRSQQAVNSILDFVEKGEIEKAILAGRDSEDFVAKTMVYGLTHRKKSFSSAFLQAANLELKRYSQGLPALDTIITLAPLLGLLGTVTGMIRAFGLLGQTELEAPAAITGGIAEALIATAFGLGIAILALIPFNYLNSRLEETRQIIEDASTHLELCLRKSDRRFS
ncbi:MAG: MotA/TolQ/ExbB proton channel family protein [Candidatus Omnitrophica bacterium]|nr:MotA/TolQ/ExbB proton channel family protein [Candidatus Omnitrophota bacterium]